MTGEKSLVQQLDDGTEKALGKIPQKFPVNKLQRCFPSLSQQQLEEAHRLLHDGMRTNFLQDYEQCKSEMNVNERLEELWKYINLAGQNSVSMKHDNDNGKENSHKHQVTDPENLARQLLYAKKQSQLDQLQAAYREQIAELEALRDGYLNETSEMEQLTERIQSIASHSLISAVSQLEKLIP